MEQVEKNHTVRVLDLHDLEKNVSVDYRYFLKTNFGSCHNNSNNNNINNK